MTTATGFRKPTTCLCGGGYRRNKHQWRVIEREPYPRLKCMGCRWRWVSRRLYVAKLQEHQEDHQGGLTDEDILARILDGTLQVSLRTCTVLSITKLGCQVLKVTERESNGSTYRFVTIRRNGKKKKIARHKLVWMAGNKRVVPDGYDVDHIQGPSDQFSNLRLLDRNTNRSRRVVNDTQDAEF